MTTLQPSAPASPLPIAVLGAGITGLTAAWHLRRAGLTPLVFEKSSRVGGAIGAIHQDGWLHELGPNSLLEGSPEVADLIDAVGLAARRLYASPAAKQRYIVRAGRLVAMPTSPLSFATTPLFSLRAKLALLREPFRGRASPAARESVADFVVRRLGREFLDYAINPFVGGVYAGDPRQLSVAHAFPKLHAIEQEHGSLIRGALAKRNTSGGPKGRIFSFPHGLEELPRTLAATLGDAVHLNTRVTALRQSSEGWELDVLADGATRTERFSAIISALPADALAALHFDNVPAAAGLATLRSIEHPPVASVFLGYERADVAHSLDGFGVLVPEIEQRRILGTLFSSTLFPGRAPQGHVALTTFVGGTRQPDLARLDDRELLHVVQEELRRLLGVRGDSVFAHVQRWPRAIPQYTLGYQTFKDTMTAVEVAAPGFFIGGNARDGIALSNCVASGARLARAAIGHAQSALQPA